MCDHTVHLAVFQKFFLKTWWKPCFFIISSVDITLHWQGYSNMTSFLHPASVDSSPHLKSVKIIVKCQSACWQMTVSCPRQKFKPRFDSFTWLAAANQTWDGTSNFNDLLFIWRISWKLSIKLCTMLILRSKMAAAKIIAKISDFHQFETLACFRCFCIFAVCEECCYAADWGQIDYSVQSPDGQLSLALLWFTEMSLWLMPAAIIGSMAW